MCPELQRLKWCISSITGAEGSNSKSCVGNVRCMTCVLSQMDTFLQHHQSSRGQPETPRILNSRSRLHQTQGEDTGIYIGGVAFPHVGRLAMARHVQNQNGQNQIGFQKCHAYCHVMRNPFPSQRTNTSQNS
eukprot:3970200-Amphidinium_carterae.1